MTTNEDTLLAEAAALVATTQFASASMLQRKLRIGAARADRLLNELEAIGVVGPFKGANAAREVLVAADQIDDILIGLTPKPVKSPKGIRVLVETAIAEAFPPGPAKTTQLLNLAVADITPHPDNPRKHLGDLTELAESIKTHGLLEPLVVVPIIGGDYVKNINKAQWRVIAGHRRLAAAKLAGYTAVPALTRNLSPAEQLEVMLVENLQRSDLTPVEEGHAYQQLLEFDGYTQTKIAKHTGRSTKTIKNRIAITKLPEPLLTKLDSGQLTLGDAEKLLPLADYPELLARVERAVGTYNFDWSLKSALGDVKKAKENAELRKTLEARGVTLIPIDDVSDEARHVGWLYPKTTPEEHEASCEHHIWTLDDDGRVWAECTNPDTHTPMGPGASRRENSELNELADDLAAADQTRAQWVKDNLTGYALAISDDLAYKLLLEAAYTYCDIDEFDVEDDVFDALGWTLREDEDNHDALRRILDDQPPVTVLAKILFVLLAMPTRPLPAWGWRAGNNSERLRAVTNLGYTLTPAEERALEIAAELRAPVEVPA